MKTASGTDSLNDNLNLTNGDCGAVQCKEGKYEMKLEKGCA